jgi:23S rRNA pseudouridine1911/1915/1917 synthase
MSLPAHRVVVDAENAGTRLDLFVTRSLGGREMPQLSRSGIQRLIDGGQITVNGRPAKASIRLKANDLIDVREAAPSADDLQPENLPVEIIYQDPDLMVINKPAAVIVHPAAGKRTGTLVNALLYHCADLQGIGGKYRPGIVHRLDKDTSGVMVIAKNDSAFDLLARQFKDRTIEKQYVALVWGKLDGLEGTINRPIGRHRSDRKRMSSVHPGAKTREAITEWKVEQIYRFGNQSGNEQFANWVRIRPRTGRTHQIRVHFADIGHPIVGDPVYGRAAARQARGTAVGDFSRQALHAEKIAFQHPRTGAMVSFTAPLAADIRALLKEIEKAGVDKKLRFK